MRHFQDEETAAIQREIVRLNRVIEANEIRTASTAYRERCVIEGRESLERLERRYFEPPASLSTSDTPGA